MASKIGSIISTVVALALGIGVYFLIRSALIKSGGEHLVPVLAIGMISAIPIAIITIHWEDKLMSVKAINATVTFLRKTQWVWFTVITVTTIVLYIV